MMSERKNPKLEVPEEELAEQIYSEEHEDDEQLAPLDTRASSVSEVEWIEQQQNVPLADEEQCRLAKHRIPTWRFFSFRPIKHHARSTILKRLRVHLHPLISGRNKTQDGSLRNLYWNN